MVSFALLALLAPVAPDAPVAPVAADAPVALASLASFRPSSAPLRRAAPLEDRIAILDASQGIGWVWIPSIAAEPGWRAPLRAGIATTWPEALSPLRRSQPSVMR